MEVAAEQAKNKASSANSACCAGFQGLQTTLSAFSTLHLKALEDLNTSLTTALTTQHKVIALINQCSYLGFDCCVGKNSERYKSNY